MSKSRHKAIKQVLFSEMSAAEKRVAIAKDALQQIKAKKFIILRGRWCDFIDLEDEVSSVGLIDQKALLTGKIVHEIPVPSCQVCALGAAMCSSVRLGNVASLHKESSDHDVYNQLKRYFSPMQLIMIEAAFERRPNRGSATCTFGGKELRESHLRAIEKFVNDCDSKAGRGAITDEDLDEMRAITIFKNIIKNNGLFVP